MDIGWCSCFWYRTPSWLRHRWALSLARKRVKEEEAGPCNKGQPFLVAISWGKGAYILGQKRGFGSSGPSLSVNHNTEYFTNNYKQAQQYHYCTYDEIKSLSAVIKWYISTETPAAQVVRKKVGSICRQDLPFLFKILLSYLHGSLNFLQERKQLNTSNKSGG